MTSTAQKDQEYQYLVFPLSDDLFNNGLPESNFDDHVENGIKTLISRIGTVGSGKRKLAFMVSFPGWDTAYASAIKIIDAAVKAAIKTDVAIYFFVPSVTGWQARPDLWNYDDPGGIGYNPANKNNVEWSDWSGTVYPHEYRDWGTPEQLPPTMCYSCEFIRSQISGLIAAKILPVLQEARGKFIVNNKDYLFAGITVGDEQTLYDYAYVDSVDPALGRFMSLQGAAKVPIGYNALTQNGFSEAHPPQDPASALAEVNRDFVSYWCKSLNNGGIPANKIYTHIAGGGGAGTTIFKFTNAPLRTAFNVYSRPGFTTYITGNPDNLGLIYAELGKEGVPAWGSTEANPYAADPIDPGLYLDMHFGHGASVMVLNIGATDTTLANKLYEGVYGAEAIKAYFNFLSNK